MNREGRNYVAYVGESPDNKLEIINNNTIYNAPDPNGQNRFKARVEVGGVLGGRGRGDYKQHRNNVHTRMTNKRHT